MTTPAVSVCFVCLGNICRSPTAEGVMKRLVAEAGLTHAVRVQSAGTAAYHVGKLPDPRSRSAALKRGIVLASRATQFSAADFARFDLIVAMDAQNLADLLRLAPDQQARSRVSLLRAHDPASPEGASVPDPYYGEAADFEEVLDLCEAACAGLLEHLRRERP